MNHVMIDLETMGNGARAAIIAIGAVKFDPSDTTPLPEPVSEELKDNEFYCLVDLASSMKFGMEVDASTIDFWLSQNEVARNTQRPTQNPLVQCWAVGEALFQLRKWWQIAPAPDILWSHATFDAVVLNEAYRLKKERPPWNYKDALDLRTMTRLFQEPTMAYSTENKHHALWDAWRQANLLKSIYAKTRTRQAEAKGLNEILYEVATETI